MDCKVVRTILAGAALLGLAWAQNRGVVTGTVLDEHGSPLAQAKVHVAERGAFVAHRVIEYHETDAEGHFRIAHLQWGTYIVMAGKEEAGYPDTSFGFYSNNAYPIAVLNDDSPTDEVTLRLGPKACVLDIAPVRDELTGKEIRSASITLRRVDHAQLFITTSTTVGRVLVPSSTEVEISITAPGYKSWPSPESTGEGKIFLPPEQTRKLEIRLQPDESKSSDSNKSN